MSSRETARTPRQVFGAMLRYYRERAGLSRTELARQISKSVSFETKDRPILFHGDELEILTTS